MDETREQLEERLRLEEEVTKAIQETTNIKVGWLRDLLAKRDPMDDEMWLRLAYLVRDQITIKYGFSAIRAGTSGEKSKGILLYGSALTNVLHSILSHFQVIETKARIVAIGTPQKELVNMTEHDAEIERARLLKAVPPKIRAVK